MVTIYLCGTSPYVYIWRGWGEKPRSYELDRARAHRLGRLLDCEAVVKPAPYGGLMYSWNDWAKQRRD